MQAKSRDKMKNIKVLIAAILLLTSCSSNGKTEEESQNFKLVKLAEGVYGCIHKLGGKAIGNSGIVDNGNETIIFDSFLSPQVSEELIEMVKKLKISPIKYVINSHGHNDHIRGNQSFNSEVKIVSTKLTAEKIKKDEPQAIKAEKVYGKAQYEYFDKQIKKYKGDTTSREYTVLKMMKPYFEELSQSHEKIITRIPDIYVNGEKEISGKTRSVKLIELDSCHTISDLIMYLPQDKILFSGDVIFNEYHPYLGDGNPDQLKTELIKIEKMKIEKIVPGHGEIGGKESITKMIEYLEDLDSIVNKIIEEEGELEELRKKEIPGKYEKWWLGHFYQMNLKFLYKLKKTGI